MSVPAFIYDGTLSTATQDGPATWHLPFQDRGDTQSFEYKAMFTQLAANFVPLQNSQNPLTTFENVQAIVTARGVAYLVEEGDPTDAGAGLLRFSRTYASLPRTRYEKTTIVYPYQFLSIDPGYDWDNPPEFPEVAELPLTLSATVTYEYFLHAVPDVLYAPKVKTAFGRVFYFGGWASGSVLPGQEILAEDSETRIYKPGMMERKSVRVIPAFTSP